MTENWLPIPGFPGYEVSDMGRVKSLKRNHPHILSPALYGGYYSVHLRSNGTGHLKRVHHLVMLAFIGPMPKGLEVCHGPGGSEDNRLSNLRYDTHEANIQDAVRSGSYVRKVLPEQVVKIRNSYAQGQKTKDIASDLGIDRTTVSNLLSGKTHQHLPGKRTILQEAILEKASQIRIEYANNPFRGALTVLAEKYRMDVSAISLIVNGKRCLKAGGPIKGLDY